MPDIDTSCYVDDIAHVARLVHEDLAQIWELHEKDISEAWIGYSESEREHFLAGHKSEVFCLEQAEENKRDDFFFLIGDLDFLGEGKEEANFVMEHLEHRATTSLVQQFYGSFGGRPGDASQVRFMIGTSPQEKYEDWLDGHWRTFDPQQEWGRPFYGDKIDWAHDQVDYSLELAKGWDLKGKANPIQPAKVGNHILARQVCAVQYMNLLAWELLALRWKKLGGDVQRGKHQGPGAKSLIDICLNDKNANIPISDLAGMAAENKKSFEDWTRLCRTDSRYLVTELYIWYFTQPGLVPDSDDKVLHAISNRQVSPCMFELLHGFALSAGIWDFISRLLRALEDDDRFYRPSILQELVNMIEFEYERCQASLRRYTLKTIGHGHLKRIDSPDNGPRIVPKHNPELLTRIDPFASYVLRLYKSETSITDAVPWIQKIFGLYKADDDLREEQGPHDIMREFAAVVGLHRQLKQQFQLPAPNSRKGRTYIKQVNAMVPDIELIKEHIDLFDLVVPPDRLYCPGVRETAYKRVEEAVENWASTELGTVYEEISESCMADIIKACDEKRAQTLKDREMAASNIFMVVEKVKGLHIEQRKTKIKTRPTVSPEDSAQGSDGQSSRSSSPGQEVFKVKQDSYDVFEGLFSRAEGRGTLDWSSFTAAMADLGFSVDPRYGSAVTFEPPESLSHLKSFTFHRPHEAHLEGYRLLWLSKRLKRVYGWDMDSFEVV